MNTPARRWRESPGVLTAGIVVLALAASVTGLANGFAYDDRWIIVQNANVHELGRWWRLFGETYWPAVAGGSLYRPLTSLAIAVQWAIGGGSPWPFHVVSIVLYAVLCAAVYGVMRRTLPSAAAWLAAALYAVHPVHVEAVGNAVGQSELWAGLCVIFAIILYLDARATMPGTLPLGTAAAIVVLFTAGCLFKEHAIVLPAVLVAAECLVAPRDRQLRVRLTELRPLGLTLLNVALVYLAVRVTIVGGVAGDTHHPAFADRSLWERVAIMLGVVPELVRLLVWPAVLKADYSPRDVSAIVGPFLSLVPGIVLVLGVATAAIVSVTRQRAQAVAFGLVWLAIAFVPVSNVLIPTGILIAERTLLLPSVGAMLAIGGALALIWDGDVRTRRLAAAACACLLAAGVVRSARRQRDWRSTATVIDRLLDDAPLNYRGHLAYGALLFERGDGRRGEEEWRLAIRLYPEYHGVWASLAERYREGGFCAPALPLYETALGMQPKLPQERAGYTVCLLRLGFYEKARTQALLGVAGGVDANSFRILLALADSALAARPPERR